MATRFFTPEVLSDPFDFYRTIRSETPVLPVKHPVWDRPFFLVTSFALVQDVLRNAETFSSKFNELFLAGAQPNPEAEAIYKTGWQEVDVMLTSDPPQQQRYRALAAKAFGPKIINLLEPRILEATNLLIDGFADKGECDFIEAFAAPLPVYMISDMLGIDRSMIDSVRRWSDAMVLRNGQMGTVEQEIDAAREIVECQHFLYQQIVDRRANPTEDLISELVYAEAAGEEPFNDNELISLLLTILVGGNETTRNALIGTMSYLLRGDRSAYHAVMADRTLIPNAIEEALRMEPPAATTFRIAKRDASLGGVDIPAGSVVLCGLAASNRDPAMFEQPETFDPARRNANRHLTFGMGIHFCIGHVLARRELKLAIGCLLERLPDIHMVPEKSDLSSVPMVHLRAIRGLHIRFHAEAARSVA